MGLCLNIFSIGQGLDEKNLTAKGVRSPKSLGTAGLMRRQTWLKVRGESGQWPYIFEIKEKEGPFQ